MRHIDQEEKGSGAVSSALPREAKTMVLTRSMEKVIGPRLVCTTISGESNICPLDKTKLVIGRSVEADLNLLDPLVSRKHCVIEDRQDGFFLRNVSTTNPLLLNDKPITEDDYTPEIRYESVLQPWRLFLIVPGTKKD